MISQSSELATSSVMVNQKLIDGATIAFAATVLKD
jgi:hypothetical protein